jgi:multimeric flavodoxin WrbA
MNILVLNGSPKGQSSNTFKLTQAFLNGMDCLGAETIDVCKLNIKPCMGCFSCWNKTPGKCVIADDMSALIEKIIDADVVIWSFPLYYFSVPGGLKNLIDRQLPMNLPFMLADAETGGHPARYDLTCQRNVVVSTCGFWTSKGNYTAVDAQFSHMFGENGYEKIYCGQGELFRVPELRARTGKYLDIVRQAGDEFANWGISASTAAELAEPLYPRKVFEQMADASWEAPSNGESAAEDDGFSFTKQMAALYCPDGKERVIEFVYTDINKTYQLVCSTNGHEVIRENFRQYTTRIETPYSVWRAISLGEITGQDALFQHKYSVSGDFDLMLHWDDLFGGVGKAKQSAKTSAQSVFARRGKKINAANIAGASMFLAFVISGASAWFMAGLDFLFGLFWGVTVFLKIPLTCYFSASSHGGEKMLDNPLFVRTNRIITACWAVDYLLMAAFLVFCKLWDVPDLLSGILSYAPAPLMGAFTAWFQKWYPAKFAKG